MGTKFADLIEEILAVIFIYIMFVYSLIYSFVFSLWQKIKERKKIKSTTKIYNK